MKNASSVSTRGISRRALLRAVSLGATGTGVGLLLMACGEKKEVEKVVATAAPTVAVATAAPTTAAATAAPTATAAVTTAAPVATTAAPVVTTAAAVATTPAAAPKMEPLKGGTVTIGGLVPFEPIFNLYRQGSRHQQVVTEALYLHLWYGGTWGDGDVPDDVGGGGKWAPGVADRWDIVEPGRVVRFHINPKVKWHDGKPVTADDVIYGFHIASHPDWGQKRGASDYRAVKGMIEWTKNPTNDVQDAGGLTKIDNMTVQVTLERPDPTWWSRPLRDNSSNFPPLPKHLWEKVPPKDAFTAGPYVREPVGCGPFKFVRFVQGQFMEMERNPDFVFGAPLIDKYIVRFGAIDAVYAAAEKGEVDHVRHSNVAFWERLKGLPHIKSNIIPLPETYAMSVNRVDPAFKNVKMPVFIQGMARSIDRNKINETIMKSTVTISDNYFSHVPIVASPPAGIVPKITYDLEAAKKLIKDSGYDTNSVLKWPYTGTVAPEYQAIISYLAEAGIKIEIVPGDGPTVEKMVREQKLHGIGNTHLGFYNNLISAWQRFKCGFDFAAGGLNVDSICDPELDGLFEKASLATTVEALTPLWLDVSRRLHGLDTMLFAPLWRYSLLPSYHRRVQGPQWRHNDSRAVRPPLEKIWIDPNWDKK